MEFKLCRLYECQEQVGDHYWKGTSKPRLEVLVVGANNTGASYMKLALERLFHEPCLHCNDIRQPHLDDWLRLYQTEDVKLQKEFLSHLLSGFRTASGQPTAAYLKILLTCYPNLKVILTVRDAEKWLASSRRTILSKRSELSATQEPIFGRLRDLLGFTKMHAVYMQALRLTLGETTDLTDDSALINAYVRWNESVRKIVPPDRLLVYNLKEGWAPLCDFLQRPMPDTLFPGPGNKSGVHLWLRRNRQHLISGAICCLLYTVLAILVFHVIFGNR